MPVLTDYLFPDSKFIVTHIRTQCFSSSTHPFHFYCKDLLLCPYWFRLYFGFLCAFAHRIALLSLAFASTLFSFSLKIFAFKISVYFFCPRHCVRPICRCFNFVYHFISLFFTQSSHCCMDLFLNAYHSLIKSMLEQKQTEHHLQLNPNIY